jgi:hypothetical protein
MTRTAVVLLTLALAGFAAAFVPVNGGAWPGPQWKVAT